MSFPRRRLAVALLLGSAGALADPAPQPVTITGAPVAPPIATPGTGLCVASAISVNPAIDFPTSLGTYDEGVNVFLEAHSGDRVTSVMRTVFDLSNNNMQGQMLSYGDFTNSMSPQCPIGGCPFFVNDTTTSFASRFRGFLNVTADLAGRPLHLGFYLDDAASLTFWDKSANSYPVIVRPPVLGAATWRSTNTVTFAQPGLYPLEIVYAQIVEHAALELSVLDGTFTDFEAPANQVGAVDLKTAGFQLLGQANFFETDDGEPPFADPSRCQQCDRQFANLPGNGGCGPGYYCNEAALCAPCTSSLFCGASCSPCGGDTPFCVNVNGAATCSQCRMDADCAGGKHCDPLLHTCAQCDVDGDCPRGQSCVGHKCAACDTRTSCAGASCNCCAGGSNVRCEPLVAGGAPLCVECASDAECDGGKQCDTVNGRCVGQPLPDCHVDSRCGPGCVDCTKIPGRPFCLDGAVCVACRGDTDCAAGSFCESGGCFPCAVDRRCGARCASCAGDTPFCLSDGTAAHAACVRCRDDADCVGGACSTKSHTCSGGCAMTCATGLFCDGARCVQCYADAQCPCGGSCDLASGTCTAACVDSTDCLPDDHCTAADHVCAPGRLEPGLQPEGGALCDCLSASVGARRPRAGASGALAIALLVTLLALARRRS